MPPQTPDARFHAQLREAKQAAGALPPPSPEQQACSEALIQTIRQEIEINDGAIDFARFMELALYAPGLGYYSAGQRKFGEEGDFITAPELSPLFGRCLARQCQQILRSLRGGDILEAGAGSGALAVDCLLELEALDSLPGHYYILELSADLRERQADTLQKRAARLFEKVRWLDRLPAAPFRGVVLGNELLDAMPVHRFRVSDQGIRQLHVGWEDGRFVWREQPAMPQISTRVDALQLQSGYASEINLNAEAWIVTMAERLEAGAMLLIDYGFPQAEYYHPQRSEGTLMCHYRHRAHHDPLILTGLQDITAHVDFTAMAEAAHGAGLKVAGYTSQAAFLLGLGLDRLAADSDPEHVRQHLAMTSQIKKLTSPAEMGELFKAIAFTRGLDEPLLGFQWQDRRVSL